MSLRESVQAFQQASLRRRVAMRYAAEFPSDEARKKYLDAHPKADPSNHTVKNDGGGKTAPKENVDAEVAKAETRSKETDANFKQMQELKKKVDNADEGAKKKFNRAYSKLFENGEAAAKTADKLTSKFRAAEGQAGFAVELLERKLLDWNRNKSDHHNASGEHAHEKLQQAEQTHAYAQSVEQAIFHLNMALKGEFDR